MKQTRLSNRQIILVLIVALLVSAVPVAASAGGTNPPDTSIRARLKDAALRYNVPSAVLMAIAYQESGWRQFDASG
ncbi:MAG: hypothetical protein NTW63_01950, partial [Caldiserica bacterium]|nr:hypothetical protein [Caldisericota bacterium]